MAEVLLLDAGIWVASVDSEDPFGSPARELLGDAKRRLGAIDLTLYEIANAVGRKRGRVREAAAYVAVSRRHNWQLVSTDIKDLVSRGLAITPDAAV